MSRSIPVSRLDGQARGLPPAPFWPRRNRAPRSRRRYHRTRFSACATRWTRLYLGREGKHKSQARSDLTPTAHNPLATNPFAIFSPTTNLSRRSPNAFRALPHPMNKPEIRSRGDVGRPSFAATCGEGFRLPGTVQRLTNKLPCPAAQGITFTSRKWPARGSPDRVRLPPPPADRAMQVPLGDTPNGAGLGRLGLPTARRIRAASECPAYLPKASMNFTRPRTSW